MTCPHRRLDDPNGLLCDRPDAHDPTARGGHTYTGSAGPDLDSGKHHADGSEQ